MFPEKELHGLSPNFQRHVSVSDLYIPRIGPHIFLQQKRRIYIAHRHMNVCAISFSGNMCFEFSIFCLCTVVIVFIGIGINGFCPLTTLIIVSSRNGWSFLLLDLKSRQKRYEADNDQYPRISTNWFKNQSCPLVRL